MGLQQDQAKVAAGSPLVDRFARISPFAVLVAAMALTGANVPIGKQVALDFPLLFLLTFRFVIACLALALMARPSDWSQMRRVAPRHGIAIAMLALFGSILFMAFLLEGTKRTTATSAGIITATLPAVVAILAAIFLQQRLHGWGLFAIGCAMAGLIVTQLGGWNGNPTSSADLSHAMIGNLLVLAAVLCEALFVLMSARVSAAVSPIALSFLVSAASLVLALPLTILHVAANGWPGFTAASLGLAIWYALVASVFVTVLWYAAVSRTPAWQAGLATAALPIAALIGGVVMFGETLDRWQLLGGALVIAAIGIGALQGDVSQPPMETAENQPSKRGPRL